MVRPGYKQTEVGEIPEDWDVVSVGDISDVKTGPFGSALHEKDYVVDGTPIITVEHLGELGITYQNLPMVSDVDKHRLSAYSLKEGDIVFSRVGSIDRNAIVGMPEQGWLFSGRLLRVRLKGKENSPKYLSYHFHSEPFKRRVVNVAVGQTMASLNTEILKGKLAVVPKAYDEQKLIAKALSDVDELIVSLEKLIAKKRDIKTATMQQLLTGKKRLPGFGEGKGYKQTELGEIPEDWDVLSLGQLLRIRHGKSQKDVFDPNGEYPILATGGVIGWAAIPLYSKPSVLIGRKGTIDTPYFMDTPFWTVDTLFYSEVSDNADAKFLYYKFLFIDWYQYNEASGVPSLNAATIEKITQVVPTNKDEQLAISSFITDFDIEIASLVKRLSKTKAIKQGMMQELLTGRTRLVDVAETKKTKAA